MPRPGSTRSTLMPAVLSSPCSSSSTGEVTSCSPVERGVGRRLVHARSRSVRGELAGDVAAGRDVADRAGSLAQRIDDADPGVVQRGIFESKRLRQACAAGGTGRRDRHGVERRVEQREAVAQGLALLDHRRLHAVDVGVGEHGRQLDGVSTTGGGGCGGSQARIRHTAAGGAVSGRRHGLDVDVGNGEDADLVDRAERSQPAALRARTVSLSFGSIGSPMKSSAVRSASPSRPPVEPERVSASSASASICSSAGRKSDDDDRLGRRRQDVRVAGIGRDSPAAPGRAGRSSRARGRVERPSRISRSWPDCKTASVYSTLSISTAGPGRRRGAARRSGSRHSGRGAPSRSGPPGASVSEMTRVATTAPSCQMRICSGASQAGRRWRPLPRRNRDLCGATMRWAWFVSVSRMVRSLPHTPGLDASMRHTSRAARARRITAAAAHPASGSRDATRTTQQRRPPFSKKPRTA